MLPAMRARILSKIQSHPTMKRSSPNRRAGADFQDTQGPNAGLADNTNIHLFEVHKPGTAR
jgi:hypothetical protein